MAYSDIVSYFRVFCALDVVYVGLAHLLPEELRPLCSCAGLFFLKILDEQDEEIVVHIAALSRYFDADRVTQSQHIREITLTYEQLDQLVEYDRVIAAKATCDLREEVAKQAMLSRRRVARWHALAQKASAVGITGGAEVSVATDTWETEAAAPVRIDHEDADLAPLPTVFVPRSVVREVFCDLHITALRERRVHTAMLVAALRTVEEQLDRESSTRRRQNLEKRCDQIREVQQWRRKRRDRGYGWQRVVVLEEAWDHGRPGWDVIIGTPIVA